MDHQAFAFPAHLDLVREAADLLDFYDFWRFLNFIQNFGQFLLVFINWLVIDDFIPPGIQAPRLWNR